MESLNLSPQQISNHLPTSDPHSVVKRDDVHGGEEAVCETEWEHEGNPAGFDCEYIEKSVKATSERKDRN